MTRRSGLFATLMLVVGCTSGTMPEEPQALSAGGKGDALGELARIPKLPHQAVCAETTRAGQMRCLSRVRVNAFGEKAVTATPDGIGRKEIASAYALPATGGAGKVVAIVDAFDDPKAEADLAVYRSTMGIPPCTTANGCFKKVNQRGKPSPLPTADSGWAVEIALDLDMVSAACPDCGILLVEADGATIEDLGGSVSTAAKLGAAAISNSYGGGEDATSLDAEQFFNHPGVAITVSSGDSGFGIEYPSSSSHVIAVGGTSLTASTAATRGWVEGAWDGAGSGCSSVIAKPEYQKDTGCAKRTVADVSAVADPNTGVAVYATFGASGWIVVGGTSASSPLVAAVMVLTGHAGDDASLSYTHPEKFFDVSTGNNGECGGSYLCTSVAGYDGPTGNGAPNGAALIAQ